jgi:hypothetical protein
MRVFEKSVIDKALETAGIAVVPDKTKLFLGSGINI